LAAGIEAGSVRAEETVFETSLVTSTPAAQAARMSVELAAGTDGVAVVDGAGTIESGQVKIDVDGKVELELEGVKDAEGNLIDEGIGFLLINQGDADGDGDRDFVFSDFFVISEGEVDVEFEVVGTVSIIDPELIAEDCPDATFMVNETLVTAEENTEYENGSCADLFGTVDS
jgi:hypothetical protein